MDKLRAKATQRATQVTIAWPDRHLVGPDEVSPVPFHQGQDWAWDTDKRWVAVISGTQSGKTAFGPWWLAREIERGGAGDYIAATATYDLFKLKMLPSMLKVLVEILGIGRYWGGDRVIEIRKGATPGGRFLARTSKDPMWARVILRSAESEGGLEAATAKAAWLDEAGQPGFQLAAWNAVRRRLALNQGRALITTTLYDLGWVKQKFIDPVEETEPVEQLTTDRGAEMMLRENEDICLIQLDSIVNPAYPLDEYEELQAVTADDEFSMFYRGRASKLRTMIYDCYDAGVNRTEAFEVPHDWLSAVGVDPVGAHIGAVWGTFSPRDNRLHIYREYREPFGKTTAGHADAIQSATHERVVRWIVGQPSERQPRLDWDWSAPGVQVDQPPFADVWTGIGRVYALLKSGDMVIHDCCEGLLSELGSYQRKKNPKTGELTDDILNKGQYDLLDALRYLCAWLTQPRDKEELQYRPHKIVPF